MLEIVEVDREEVFDINENEWNPVNDAHFGKGIRWNTTPFRFKAVENGAIVGLIYGKHESGTVYISNIIVFEKHRRKGIGTKLISKAEKFGHKFGDHKIWLISGKHYSEDPFFEKVGFKKEAVLPNLYFNKDFIVYAKSIST